jgi:hypothetical protein
MKAFRKLKYFIKNFDFLKVYNSPFRKPRLKLYTGKVAIGTPYFLPRKWVKATPERATKAALQEIEDVIKYNERSSEYKRKVRSFDDLYKEKMRYNYPEPKKIGFDFVQLGWKSKWTDTDYRFEWSPIWSFVFFKWQVAITFIAPERDHYWECWLYYTRNTDKTKSINERIEQARKEFPCNWTSTKDGVEEKICYWDLVLKPKYVNS